MEPGASIDIVTRRPKVLDGGQADRERKRAQTEAELRARAEDLALGFSDEGARFRGLVEKRLIARVLELIRDDPEASGYQKIIADMGHRFNAAKQAVDKLYQAHMGGIKRLNGSG